MQRPVKCISVDSIDCGLLNVQLLSFSFIFRVRISSTIYKKRERNKITFDCHQNRRESWKWIKKNNIMYRLI